MNNSYIKLRKRKRRKAKTRGPRGFFTITHLEGNEVGWDRIMHGCLALVLKLNYPTLTPSYRGWDNLHCLA